MTAEPTDCAHDNLEFDPSVVAFEGMGTFVQVRVRCIECRTLFHWAGINSGNLNAAEPVVSADGYMLTAPVRPGPGAVVGLLHAVGLEDKLVNPGLPNNGTHAPENPG